jgi:hypothetical protein
VHTTRTSVELIRSARGLVQTTPPVCNVTVSSRLDPLATKVDGSPNFNESVRIAVTMGSEPAPPAPAGAAPPPPPHPISAPASKAAPVAATSGREGM